MFTHAYWVEQAGKSQFLSSCFYTTQLAASACTLASTSPKWASMPS